MDARIREARPEDLPAILALMSASLGGGMPRDPEFFRWKHEANPFGTSFTLVAEDDEGLVGLRTMMQWCFLQGDRVIRAVRPVDTATHPRFRRRGLFTKLTRDLLATLAEREIQLVFNTPNEKSRPGYLKMGWQSVGVVPLWVRPGGRFNPLRRSVRAGAVRMAPVSDARLQTHRTDTYLAWRYHDAPGLDYRVLGDGTAGVVVRDRVRGERKELTIVELVIPRRRDIPRVASQLRRTVAASDALYALAVAAVDTRQAAALTMAGFIPVGKRGPHLVARSVEGAPVVEGAFSLSGWRVQAGDLEVF